MRATITHIVDRHLTGVSTIVVDGRETPIPERSKHGYELLWHRVADALEAEGLMLRRETAGRYTDHGHSYTVEVEPIDETGDEQ